MSSRLNGWALIFLIVVCFMSVIIFSPSFLNYWFGNPYLLYLKFDEKPKTHLALTQARAERITVRGVTRIDVYEVKPGGKEWESPRGWEIVSLSGTAFSVYASGDSLIEVAWLTRGVDGRWVSGGGREINKEGVTIENTVPAWTDQVKRFLNETN